MAPGDRKYWNPYLETLSRDEITAIQLKRFRDLLGYAKINSVFYRDRYRDIDPADIKTMEDIRKLPLIDKKDLREAQDGKEPFPFGEILGVPPRRLAFFAKHQEQPGNLYTFPRAGRVGSGEWRCGATFSGWQASARPIECSSRSGTTCTWPSGKAIALRRNLVAW